MSNQSDNLSLAHTSWSCKYHIVFAPKYRRKEFFGLKRLEIGAILRKLCEWKGITIHEAGQKAFSTFFDNHWERECLWEDREGMAPKSLAVGPRLFHGEGDDGGDQEGEYI